MENSRVSFFNTNFYIRKAGDIMTLRELLEPNDDWNKQLIINDDDLNCITKDVTWKLVENRKDLMQKKVRAYGFYDNEMYVRIIL